MNQVENNEQREDFKFEVVRFQSGRRYNMVPDFAKVALNVCQQTNRNFTKV